MGGQNSQDSVLERRSLVWNDDDILNGVVPGSFRTGDAFYGKFFPRGCRGMIEQIQVYCIAPAAGSLTLRWSAHPGIGPFYEGVIAPGPAWSWRAFSVREMWNYDSLFIWISECDLNVSWALDVRQPYDMHYSSNAGVNWWSVAERPFIRVVYSGETAGDVPVSGTVNVVEIPSVATVFGAEVEINVPHDSFTLLCELEGAGTMVDAGFVLDTSVPPTAGLMPAAVRYIIYIYVDGAYMYSTDNSELTQSYVATSGRAAHGTFYQATVADPAWDRTHLNIQLPFKFRRRLTLYVTQTSGVAVLGGGAIRANLIR